MLGPNLKISGCKKDFLQIGEEPDVFGHCQLTRSPTGLEPCWFKSMCFWEPSGSSEKEICGCTVMSAQSAVTSQWLDVWRKSYSLSPPAINIEGLSLWSRMLEELNISTADRDVEFWCLDSYEERWRYRFQLCTMCYHQGVARPKGTSLLVLGRVNVTHTDVPTEEVIVPYHACAQLTRLRGSPDFLPAAHWEMKL